MSYKMHHNYLITLLKNWSTKNPKLKMWPPVFFCQNWVVRRPPAGWRCSVRWWTRRSTTSSRPSPSSGGSAASSGNRCSSAARDTRQSSDAFAPAGTSESARWRCAETAYRGHGGLQRGLTQQIQRSRRVRAVCRSARRGAVPPPARGVRVRRWGMHECLGCDWVGRTRVRVPVWLAPGVMVGGVFVAAFSLADMKVDIFYCYFLVGSRWKKYIFEAAWDCRATRLWQRLRHVVLGEEPRGQ